MQDHRTEMIMVTYGKNIYIYMIDCVTYIIPCCIILFAYFHQSHGCNPCIKCPMVGMLVMEKGKSCFFSSCQKRSHHCEVTAGMSRLFPASHDAMRARDQLELNKRTMGVLTDIARILNKQCFRSEQTQTMTVTSVCTWRLCHGVKSVSVRSGHRAVFH